MRKLLIDQPIFVGFKMDSRLRETIESLSDSEKKYVSAKNSAFLRICTSGEDRYVGKLISDNLTTDHIEDICRHVLSIIRKIGHEARVPTNLQILACSMTQEEAPHSRGAPNQLHADMKADEDDQLIGMNGSSQRARQ